jgi:hypothetical protein
MSPSPFDNSDWATLPLLPTCLRRSGHGRSHSLRTERESAGLLDDGLIDRERGPVDLDNILRRQVSIAQHEGRAKDQYTFSRSILASAPIRVSRMRFTIHFSPSSLERFNLADRSLIHHQINQNNKKSRRDSPNINPLMYPTICFADQIPRII